MANGTALPGLHCLGDPPSIQGGVDYIPGAPPAERATSVAYSGIAAAIAKWGAGTQELQNCKLAWQKAVDGDTSKIKLFHETAGGLQEFKTYLFIKKGSAYCTVLHSPMKFMAISKATQHFQGQFIGFVGDCMVTREPTPILLPLLKTWQRVKEEVCMMRPDLIEYCQEDASHRGKLWSLGEGAAKEETTVPQLLSIPLVLFKKIRAEGHPLMLHEVLKLVMAHLEHVNGNGVVAAWSLIMKWCLMAAQQDASGDSWAACSVEAITEGEDEDLSRWLEQRLSSTLGAGLTIGSPAGATGAHAQGLPSVLVQFAVELGKGVAMGLMAWGRWPILPSRKVGSVMGSLKRAIAPRTLLPSCGLPVYTGARISKPFGTISTNQRGRTSITTATSSRLG
jgi:hypothetical protein